MKLIVLIAGVLLTYISVVSAACTTQSYKEEAGKKVNNGAISAGQTTAELCKTYCTGSASCVSFDFNAANQCYVMTKPPPLEPVITTTESVTHYSAQTTCSDGATACTYDLWGQYRATSNIRSMTKSGDTQGLCANECSADSNCQAFAITGTACYIISDTLSTNLVQDGSYKMYARSSNCTTSACGAFTYVKSESMKYPGGTQVLTANTRDLCRAACTADPACIGLDFSWANNSAPNACYLSKNIDVQVISTTEGVDHYSRETSCSYSSTSCTFEIYGQFRATSILSTFTFTTDVIGNCGQECIKNTACQGFHVSGTTCQLATSSASTSRQADTSYQFFSKKANCAGVTATTTDSGISTTTTSAGGDQCGNYYFIETASSHVSGGVAVSQTQSVCSQNCINDVQNCRGYDFSKTSSNSCWTISGSNSNPITVDNTANHYTLAIKCTGSGRECVYTSVGQFKGKLSVQVQSSSVASMALCQQLCSRTTTCKAVSYEGQACQLLSNSDLANLDPNLSALTWKQENCSIVSVCGNPKWTEKVQTGSPNGELSQAPTTVAACQQLCLDTANCVAIDVGVNNPQRAICYLHLNASNLNTVKNESTANQYRLDRCPGAGCSSTWEEVINAHGIGGVQQPANLNTLEACQTACEANSSCLALDYSLDSKLCWFFYTAYTNESLSRVNHYVITRCKTCDDTFNKTANYHSLDGVPGSPELDSEAKCKAYCTANLTCVAFDLDRGVNRCWFQYKTGYGIEGLTNVDHYIIQRCDTGLTTLTPTATPTATPTGTTTAGCPNTWANTTSRSSGNGQQQTYTNLNQCLEECVKLSTCVAVDYGLPSNRPCWFHLNSSDLTDERTTPGITQYRLTRCDTGTSTPTSTATPTPRPGCGLPVWRKVVNTHAFSGQRKTEYSTLATCKEACAQDTNCAGFDAVNLNNTSPFQCWFHDNSSVNSQGPDTTSILYVLVNRCPSAGCVNTWTNITSRSSGNGQQQTAYTNLNQCLEECVKLSTCVAVDYSTSCWFHLDISNLADERNTQGVTQYQLKRCVDKGCPKFTEYANKNAQGGVPRPENTLDTCKQACLNEANCKAIDYDKNAAKCYFFTMKKAPNGLGDLPGVTHYDLICRAGETIPPTGTTRGITSTTPSSGTTTSGLCTVQWEERLQTEGKQGSSQESIRTESDCRTQCAASETCYGYTTDPDPSTYLCWFYDTAAKANDTRPATRTGVKHYIKRSCVQACTATFGDGIPNRHVVGGTQITLLNGSKVVSLQFCQDTCASVSLCQGIDYKAQTSECWWLTTNTPLALENGVTHYDINRNCPSSGPSTTAQPSGQTTRT